LLPCFEIGITVGIVTYQQKCSQSQGVQSFSGLRFDRNCNPSSVLSFFLTKKMERFPHKLIGGGAALLAITAAFGWGGVNLIISGHLRQVKE